jgi:hypothetical protein
MHEVNHLPLPTLASVTTCSTFLNVREEQIQIGAHAAGVITKRDNERANMLRHDVYRLVLRTRSDSPAHQPPTQASSAVDRQGPMTSTYGV